MQDADADLTKMADTCKGSGKLFRQFSNLPLGITIVAEMTRIAGVIAKSNFCKKRLEELKVTVGAGLQKLLTGANNEDAFNAIAKEIQKGKTQFAAMMSGASEEFKIVKDKKRFSDTCFNVVQACAVISFESMFDFPNKSPPLPSLLLFKAKNGETGICRRVQNGLGDRSQNV